MTIFSSDRGYTNLAYQVSGLISWKIWPFFAEALMAGSAAASMTTAISRDKIRFFITPNTSLQIRFSAVRRTL